LSFLIDKDEATAGRRRVPFRLFLSDGTSPDTNASNGTMLGSLNGAAQLSLGSISVVSANAGQYYFELSQSNVSTLGSMALYTDTVATDFPQHVATVQVVNNNPMSTLSALSDVTLAAKEYSNVTVRLGLVAYSGATVGAGNFTPGVYSGVSFSVRDSGIQPSSVGAGNYSGMSVEIKTGGIQTTSMGAGSYSGVSVEIKTGGIQVVSVGQGTYSGVTVDGVNRVNSGVTLNANTHSGATIQGILDASAIWNASRSSYTGLGTMGITMQVVSATTLQGGTLSTLTLNSAETSTNDFFNGAFVALQYASGQWIGNIISDYTGAGTVAQLQNSLPIVAASGMTYVVFPGTPGVDLSLQTIQGISNYANISSNLTLGQSSLSQVADALLTRSLAGSAQTDKRNVQNALRFLRNKWDASSSVLTVYQENDSTSAWTASVTTTTDPSNAITLDPL
jgi:hypothetical protein